MRCELRDERMDQEYPHFMQVVARKHDIVLELKAFTMKTFGIESALRCMCQPPSVLRAKFAGVLEWPL
jgi:hypothetical protein